MKLSKHQLRVLYQRRAKNYDFTANLYYLLGFREWSYRKRAIRALKLNRGDTVLEIGCGTGLNFPLIQDEIGPEGKIIGLDLSDSMLEIAEARSKEYGWTNVQLINADAAEFDLPEGINAAISSFAITLIPEYDKIIKKVSRSLAKGGRLVILDFKKPPHMPLWLAKTAVLLTGPFGVSLELAERHPWESVERYFNGFSMENLYWGLSYIAVGEDPIGSDKSNRMIDSQIKQKKRRS